VTATEHRAPVFRAVARCENCGAVAPPRATARPPWWSTPVYDEGAAFHLVAAALVAGMAAGMALRGDWHWPRLATHALAQLGCALGCAAIAWHDRREA
jgi:hypothetical protein